MALNEDQRLKFEMVLEGTKEFERALTPWELGFVSSFAVRYEDWGDNIMISPKQWAILDRIYDSIVIRAEQAA